MARIFNPEMLFVAREARGLTQSELAKQLHIAQETISRIENGLRQPTVGQVSGFAKCLQFTEDFFFLDEHIKHFGSGCVYHRRRKKAPQSALRQLLGLINVRRIQVKRLLQSAEIDTTNQFVRFDLEEYADPGQIASLVRSIWKMPPGPIQNLSRVIEDAGGIIMRCDFGTRDIDAVSQFMPGSPPLFLVNSRIPTDRLRWTLAHELGHIVMHQIPTEHMETEADMFAAEFLTPQAQIKPYLRDVGLAQLANLKIHWKVSMSSLLRRAGELESISPRRQSYLWTQMGKSGWTSNEPVDLPPENPSLLEELVNVHSSELGYSASELSSVVFESEEQVRQVFMPPKTGLQIIP